LSTITFASKLGNLHPTSLYDEPRLWWLRILLYHRFLWLCFRGGYLSVYVSLIQIIHWQAQRL